MSFLQQCKTPGGNKPEREKKTVGIDALRSIRWTDRELISADGFKLCYSFDREGRYIVRLPGGGNINVDQLQKRFKDVRMPLNPRKRNFS